MCIRFHPFWDFSNFRLKRGGNCFIFWRCKIFFNILLVIAMFFKTLDVFGSQISRIKRHVLIRMFLSWRICKYWNIFCTFVGIPLWILPQWSDDSLPYGLYKEKEGYFILCRYFWFSLYFVGGWNYLCCFPQ